MSKTQERRSARREAALRGSRFYRGSACKRCGATKRYVLNACCVACALSAAARQRAEFLAIREQLQAAKEGK